MKIDFIAYHHLQAQAAASVFDKLKKKYDCRWLMGPFNKELSGDVGLLVDHRCFHDIYKSRSGYKYLFHLSHDIADISVYKNENLYDFDLIFVPTITHYNACVDCGYATEKIKIVGWPKYDYIDYPKSDSNIAFKLDNNQKLALLYAPTFASNYEWKKLFPFFQRIGCQVIIKNHIYVDNDQPFPSGQEKDYLIALDSIHDMESKANELGFTVAPRNENICNIFPFVDILVSDSSSCLLEFLPFGVSIETGSGPLLGALRYKPEASLLSEDVLLFPANKLVEIDSESFFNLLKVFASKSLNPFISLQSGYSAGSEISEQIDAYIKSVPPRFPSQLRKLVFLLRKIKHGILSK